MTLLENIRDFLTGSSPGQREHADMLDFYQRKLRETPTFATGLPPSMNVQVEERQVAVGRFSDPPPQDEDETPDTPVLAPPKPTVTNVNPNVGSPAGGQSVEITGTNFISTAGVKFGTAAATSVVVPSATKVTCVTPIHAAGAVDVTVRNVPGNADFDGVLSNGYTYQGPPVINSLSPDWAPTEGSVFIRIRGGNFISITSVTVGGVSATFTVLNTTTIDVVVPAHAEGPVELRVTNQFGDFDNATLTYKSWPTSYDTVCLSTDPHNSGSFVYVYSNDFYTYRITAKKADGSVHTNWTGGLGFGYRELIHPGECAAIGYFAQTNWQNGTIFYAIQLLKTHLDPGSQETVSVLPWDDGPPVGPIIPISHAPANYSYKGGCNVELYY